MPPAARITDMHTCPMVTLGVPPVQHVGGPILPSGCPTVLIGALPAARVTDMAVCVGPPDVIVKGSMTVMIGSMPAARIGDQTAHGGVIVAGELTVMIGDSGHGSAGGGGAGASGSSSATTRTVGGPGSGMVRDFGTQFILASWTVNAFLAAARSGESFVSAGDFASISDEAVKEREYKSSGECIDIRDNPDDPQYRQKVLAALQRIHATPTGAKLLASLKASGKNVTIKAPPPDVRNGMDYPPATASDRFAKPDGRRGAGTDAIIEFDPDTTIIGAEKWETRPTAIGLAHELVHVEQAAYGKMKLGKDKNDGTATTADIRELEAAGIPPYDTYEFSENKIRSEWGPKQPLREFY